MMEALFTLPAHVRQRLATALDKGLLSDPYSPDALTALLGVRSEVSNVVVGALNHLSSLGITGRGAAAWIDAVETVTSRNPRPDLVWSGPEVQGLHARDTRRVFDELLGRAQESLWICTYAYFDGPRVFDVLAQRMESCRDLRVTLLLNIQRSRGDTTAPHHLVRSFADRFWSTDWPGSERPAVYYDPRSLELEGAGAVLHAKAVVADRQTMFITSANLTEAALNRNIEMGLLVRDASLAVSAIEHFSALIDGGLIRPLPR
jgi:phosphatidylserine/phosphatidylglycerophosphate/cardiolipin synthase-like enzyme